MCTMQCPEGDDPIRNFRMRFTFRNFFASVWSRPDPVLAHAAVAGELLVAKVRLGLSSVLLLIPVIDGLFFPTPRSEAIVGVSLTSATVLVSFIVYMLIAREYNPAWLGFFTSSLDVTLVSGALSLFLLANQPHTAVNSKVVFEGYFLAIAATSLRYDKRVCISAGLLAFCEYFAIVFFAATHWNLNSPTYAPYEYGVFSRGYVDERFTVELSRAQRYGKVLTIAVIDADRFKLLNDTHGHQAGDLALQKIGAILQDSFRQSDTAGRYGGEEFVVILPETDIEAAQQKLESVRELVASTPIAVASRGENVQVTISAGLASFPDDAVRASELFALADERMFQAKREGRNRVVAAHEVLAS